LSSPVQRLVGQQLLYRSLRNDLHQHDSSFVKVSNLILGHDSEVMPQENMVTKGWTTLGPESLCHGFKPRPPRLRRVLP
jgi:hypothetical protein